MRSLLVLVGLLLGLGRKEAYGQCLFGWINRPGADFCYMIESVVRSWDEANLVCKDRNANLLSIESDDELSWIKNQVANDTKRGVWWTGLNDIARSGQRPFVWSDGSAVGETYIKWANNEPNNRNGNEYCCDMGKGGYFTDLNCANRLAFICKRRKDQPFFCDHLNGWEEFKGICYKSFKKDETYYDAQAICRSENAYLTGVYNVTDNQRILYLAKKLENSVWIGLKSTPTNTSLGFEFRHYDNGDDVEEFFWYSNRYPLKVIGQENNTCVYSIYWGDNPAKSWMTTACDGTNRKSFMCERQQGMCIPGWITFMSECYKINAKTPMTFEDADKDCTSVGAHLLTIKSEGEQVFVNDTILYDLREAGYSRTWFGIKQDQPTSAFYWTTGENLTDRYTNWDTNQPFIDDRNIQGGVLFTGAVRGRWAVTADVYIPTPYVCQINSAKTPMFIKPPPPQYRCDTNAGWQRWRNSCYYVNTTAITWLYARQSCKDNGADLVDIRSEQENSFLIGRIQSDTWIGINDIATEGKFVWLDESTTPNFTKWNPGEPNNLNEEHCGLIWTGERTGQRRGFWNDKSCDAVRGFICKKTAEILVSPEPPTAQPAIWTPKCGYAWEDDPMSDYCYRFVTEVTTWTLAQQHCQLAGGDLLSITSLHEQYYVFGRVKTMDSLILWTGFNDKAREGRWKWSDGSAESYFNWNGGFPKEERVVGGFWVDIREPPGKDCGVILTSHGRWDDEGCNKRFGYICKKKGDVPTTTSRPRPTTTMPSGFVLGCPPGWKAWRDSCYKFVKADGFTGDTGLTTCRRYGGDLASIRDSAEDNYIKVQTKSIGGNVWLIGINDKEKEGVYKWTDGSPVTYTNWGLREPNDYGHGEDCGNINPQNYHGYWNDLPCGSDNPLPVKGLVCKTKQIPRAPTTGAPTFLGCSSFYDLGYGQSCYKFVETKISSDNAEADCVNNGGHLVAISDASEQAYLSSQLALRSDEYWIGLSNKGDPGGVYSWTSGERDTFSHWNGLHSGNERNKCVAAGTGASLGLWYDNDCNQTKKYICENDTNPTTARGPLTCPQGWVLDPVWNKCYKAFVNYHLNRKKSWENARDYCRTFGGDLISIHSNDTERIIADLIPVWGNRPFWIGLNSRDPSTVGHTWSDGSAFNFANWRDNQPDNFNNQENCVTLQSRSWDWNDLNCYNARDWICQMPTNTPLPTSAAPLPTGDTSPSCGQGWIHYNGMCYLNVKQKKDWYKSRAFCNGLGGDLVHVNDQDENNFLLQMIASDWGERWIGLNELDLNGYKWIDGSPATYFNWAPGEPNDYFGAERCVTMSHLYGFWNDENCGHNFMFICEKVNGSYSTVVPATKPPAPGNCRNGYFAVGDNCFKYFDQDVNYTTAFETCRSFGREYHLATINSANELASILLKITARKPFYIGLHQQVHRTFIWNDNSEVKFVNWANGEPNRPYWKREDCVEVNNDGSDQTGKWYSIACGVSRHFLCQGPKDPLAPTPVTPINPCKNGYQSYGDSCYKFDSGLRTWDQANRYCQADGATVVSMRDPYEFYFVHKMIWEQMPPRLNDTVWTGLTDKTIPGMYIWSDNWPVTYTNWGKNEPQRGKDEGCVAMKRESGEWQDIKCADTLPVVCKISTATPPTLPPVQISQCDHGWFSFPITGMCYRLSDRKVSWPEANFQCIREGATLVSIHSDSLNNKLVSAAMGANLRVDSFWIGLFRRGAGGFSWTDNSAVGFTKWNTGEPNNYGGVAEECGQFFKANGLWNDCVCTVRMGYICMKQGKSALPVTTPQVNPDTPIQSVGDSTPNSGGPVNTPAPPVKINPRPNLPSMVPREHSSKGSEIGLIVGVSAGVLLLLAAVSAGVIYWKKQKFAANVGGFDNAMYMKSDDTVNIQGNVAKIDTFNHQIDDRFNNPGISLYVNDALAC